MSQRERFLFGCNQLTAYYSVAEGQQRIHHQLKVLQAKWYADDGNAECSTENGVNGSEYRAAENKPDDVAYRMSLVVGINVLAEGAEDKFGHR